jgi:hypothetical protein
MMRTLFEMCAVWVQGVSGGHCAWWAWTREFVAIPD